MKLCSFNGCDRKHCAKGYCQTHYYQAKRDGIVRPIWTPNVGCIVPDCEGKHSGKGYCGNHRKQINQHGFVFSVMVWSKECQYCGKQVASLGLCSLHYDRFRKGQEMEAPIRFKGKSKVYDIIGNDPKKGETAIYVLEDRRGIVWYVGQTKQGLLHRIKNHFNSRQRPERTKVIRHLNEDSQIGIRAIRYVDDESAGAAEREAIVEAILNGSPLLNEVSPVLIRIMAGKGTIVVESPVM